MWHGTVIRNISNHKFKIGDRIHIKTVYLKSPIFPVGESKYSFYFSNAETNEGECWDVCVEDLSNIVMMGLNRNKEITNEEFGSIVTQLLIKAGGAI